MKQIILVLALIFTFQLNAQTAAEFFVPSQHKVTWLGIDYSHVKLIGDFNQFLGIGKESVVDIRDEYFNNWNMLILKESDKYDLKGMLRKGDIFYDIAMIKKINANCPIETLEDLNTPNYTKEDITKFVSEYQLPERTGYGVVMIAETLNKNQKEAYFHFVLLNMQTREILIHERLRSEPSGFGLKNYWAGAIYDCIKLIRDVKYHNWKSTY